ncbi:MAG: hypothetical protein WBE89_20335 [Methyloceanibacter sp.]
MEFSPLFDSGAGAEHDDVLRAKSDQFRVLLGRSSLSFLHFLLVNSFTMRVTSGPSTFVELSSLVPA